MLELFGDDERLARWIRMAGERVAFQGLPARICWLGYGEREVAGARFNEMVHQLAPLQRGQPLLRPFPLPQSQQATGKEMEPAEGKLVQLGRTPHLPAQTTAEPIPEALDICVVARVTRRPNRSLHA